MLTPQEQLIVWLFYGLIMLIVTWGVLKSLRK